MSSAPKFCTFLSLSPLSVCLAPTHYVHKKYICKVNHCQVVTTQGVRCIFWQEDLLKQRKGEEAVAETAGARNSWKAGEQVVREQQAAAVLGSPHAGPPAHVVRSRRSGSTLVGSAARSAGCGAFGRAAFAVHAPCAKSPARAH